MEPMTLNNVRKTRILWTMWVISKGSKANKIMVIVKTLVIETILTFLGVGTKTRSKHNVKINIVPKGMGYNTKTNQRVNQSISKGGMTNDELLQKFV